MATNPEPRLFPMPLLRSRPPKAPAHTRNPKSEIRHPSSRTRNPKSEIRNPSRCDKVRLEPMPRPWPSSLLFLALACALPAQEPGEFFESRVRPVLSKNCFSCHTSSKLGGLQLDSRDHLLQGGN